MSLKIEKQGLPATIQDAGRNNFRRFGINPNGAMDQTARRLINILLGNEETEAALEMLFPAPVIRFEKAAVFALGGADFGAKLNDSAIENYRSHFAGSGDILKLTKKVCGNRCYLAVKGGFEIAEWLGSFSTNLTANIGGFHGRNLQMGDQLFFKKNISQTKIPRAAISFDLIPKYNRAPTVRIIKGADFDALTAVSELKFLQNEFTITKDSNRMGFRFKGESLYLLDESERVSSAVDFGTIQLLPDGQIIVLMADHQTIGGYPQLGNVVLIDLPLLAQRGAGDAVRFQMISIGEAENLRLEFEKKLNLLKLGCKFAWEK